MKKTIALVLALGIAACSPAADDTPEPAASDTASPDAAAPPATPSAAASETAYDGPIPKPIMVGGDGPEMDACGTYAEVANLDPNGDNYLSVRDAPSTATKERDRLDAGQGVSVCVTEYGWSGVIYGKPGDEVLDCGVGMPVEAAQPYRGACRQGWVDARYLKMVAG